MDKIIIKGARSHNLKNISLEIPRNKLVVITGVSGSGKSSLAFDTLYAEGHRRYVESLSSYARQFLSFIDKPKVESIAGLSPAISIEQKTISYNPRSIVGTVTEIYDYLRVLFARIGIPQCPKHKVKLEAKTISQMVDHTLSLNNDVKLMIVAPIVVDKKGNHLQLMKKLYLTGYLRARIDGKIYELFKLPELDRYKKHTIEVVVDRFTPQKKNRQRLAESFEHAIDISGGIVKLVFLMKKNEDIIFSANHACPYCSYSLQELTPRIFSFNNPIGACSACNGLGTNNYFDINKIIINDDLSLRKGALYGWDEKCDYFYQLEAIAKYFNFSLDTKFKNLSKQYRNIVLNGSGNIKISMIYTDSYGKQNIYKKTFDGVITNFTKIYRETNSNLIRKQLSQFMSSQTCLVCNGSRLREEATNTFINGENISDVTKLTIKDNIIWLNTLKLDNRRKIIAESLLKEIKLRLNFLANLGLDYLSLSRQANTLSGGEAQRIRLASQIGAGLVGVMYVLDEPSIGLHQRDNQKLLNSLYHLRDLGNTVVVVEHDENIIKQADHIIDIGPGSGIYGGKIIAEGCLNEIIKNKISLTAKYLSGHKKIKVKRKCLKPVKEHFIEVDGIRGNNLRDIDLKIPLGLFTSITGVSGSGKSTLINQTLYPLAATILNGNSTLKPHFYIKHKGFNLLDKVINIDQKPIGRTPRSNPATYTGVFSLIRELFAQTLDARSRGYKIGRFSFNIKGGRCDACQGEGLLKIEMHFLPDVYVLCDTCKGKRYNRETLEIEYKGKNISEVLNMTIEQSVEFFSNIPQIKRRLQALIDVGMSYITLGQSATTLSGGEAQRVKLAKELSKISTGNTLYIFDEPTTGLHFYDIQQLLNIIFQLRDQGNTIIIIEHNLDVIQMSDWIIDLGPEGGLNGGKIVAEGLPRIIANTKNSHTGKFLKIKMKELFTHSK